MTTTKAYGLYFRNIQSARDKWSLLFMGRVGCQYHEVTQDDFDEYDDQAPGGYIHMTERHEKAYYAGMAEVKKNAHLPAEEKWDIIRRHLDAVT